MDNDNSNIMSENNGQTSNLLPHEIDGSYSTSLTHDTHEVDTEIRDIGTPLDDEPEININDSLQPASNNVEIAQNTRIDEIKDNDIVEATGSSSQEQLALNANSYEEPSWLEPTSRPHSSSAATPTQDDNISAEDISGIPVPTTGPQFLNFSQYQWVPLPNSRMTEILTMSSCATKKNAGLKSFFVKLHSALKNLQFTFLLSF